MGTCVAWDGSHYTIEWQEKDTTTEALSSQWTPTQVALGVTLHDNMGAHVAKDFADARAREPDIYNGKVVNHRCVNGEDSDEEKKEETGEDDEEDGEIWYKVVYEDGDVEEMDAKEIKQSRALYVKCQAKETKRKAEAASEDRTTPDIESDACGRGKRRRRTVNYQEVVDLMDTDDDEEDRKPAAKASKRTRNAKKAPAPKKRATKKKYNDDDDFSMADQPSDEDMLNDELLAEPSEDESIDFTDDDNDVLEVNPKRKATKKTAAKKKGTKKATGETDTEVVNDGRFDTEFQQKLARDRKAFKPNNNPQKWPKDGDYCDPVGIDPTHGIVEGIIAAQVRKVGGLLQMVKASQQQGANEEKLLGELSYPIRLQTACSGTDAPSIALGIMQEALDKICAESKEEKETTDKGHSFEYSHEMSCEIEPYKQAYIGRNFPGVPLFPDITKLTASEKVLDVYGRPQSIPDGNLFVAGTSCKDFSMLKTTYRLDIEDKGTSGETFLAAVEFLEQKQPSVAIFENVDGAPWPKMQEYITGRVDLASRNDTKAIKDASKKAGEYQHFVDATVACFRFLLLTFRLQLQTLIMN